MDDASSEDEELLVHQLEHRTRPRKRRPAHRIIKKNGRVRCTKSYGSSRELGFAHGCNQDGTSRDLSPVEQVREYFSDCAEEMVEDFERIYQEMSSKMHHFAETAEKKRTAIVEGGKDIYHRTAAAVEKTAKSAAKVPSTVLKKVRDWKVSSFDKLPNWMRDNEYLQFGHRPELNSYRECFKSVFRIHTETGNIWTHLLGAVVFITLTVLFYLKPLCEYCNVDIDLNEKLIFLFFFVSAILCLGISSVFHTVCCHSEKVSNLFSKLDYAGIALLTVGSFIPWIYYGFYCQFTEKVVYLTCISILGICVIIVTMLDRFNTSAYRWVRAVLFIGLGGFGFVPTLHLILQSGWNEALVEGGISWLVLMAFLYITGAVLYGARIPERFLPGKFDLWFQSHQIFHVLVVFAAIVHYHGMTSMAVHRLTEAGACSSLEYSIVLD